jgi:hypothetical protein
MLRTAIAIVVVLFACAEPAAAQSTPQPHVGGFSPFRDRGFVGTEVLGRALAQEGCPVELSVASVSRDGRGVALTLRAANTGQAPVTHHVIALWVLAADGALRGSQQSKQSRPLAVAQSRVYDVTLRALNAQAGDTIVVAVHEAATGGATSWRRDLQTLQAEVKTALGR